MSDIEILINCVQERPILWDKRNKNYHNRALAQREWENLANLIGTTSESAKKKWKNLRDTYIKEFKRNAIPRSGAVGDNEPKYTGSWPYFEVMSFLTVALKPRETYGNIEPEEDLTECDSIGLQELTDAACLEVSDMGIADNNLPQLSTPVLQEMPQSLIQMPPPLTPISSPSAAILSPSASIPLPSDLTPPLPAATPVPTAPIPLPPVSTYLPACTEPSPSTATKTATKKGTKRKRQSDDLKTYMEIEKVKLNLLQAEQKDAANDDVLWFRSIMPYLKQLPVMNKLLFRTQMQEYLLNELSKFNTSQFGQHGYATNYV